MNAKVESLIKKFQDDKEGVLKEFGDYEKFVLAIADAAGKIGEGVEPTEPVVVESVDAIRSALSAKNISSKADGNGNILVPSPLLSKARYIASQVDSSIKVRGGLNEGFQSFTEFFKESTGVDLVEADEEEDDEGKEPEEGDKGNEA